MYPELPFILIGDSGQHDPEVYLEALEQAPNRIKAIYIRNVSDPARGEQVAELAKEARRHGGALFFFGDVSEAVEHARQSGLING